MYILVKRSAPLGHAINCAAHTSLGTYLKFQDDPTMQAWKDHSFRKVTCGVTDEQFERAKEFDDHFVMEEDTIGDVEIAIGFKPRERWPRFFKRLKFYGGEDG